MKTQNTKSLLTPIILITVVIVSTFFITKNSIASYNHLKHLEANGQIFTCMLDMIQ
jgi:hypothetical protein